MRNLPQRTDTHPVNASDATRLAERTIGSMIILAATAAVVTPIISNNFRHSVNDGSRWNTVWNLAHRGTYRIDGGPWGDKQKTYDRRDDGYLETHVEGPWITIDMIRSTVIQEDGQKDLRFYSSKPPFLPTIMAGLYYVLWRVSDVMDGTGLGLQIAYFTDDATGDSARRIEHVDGHVAGRILLILFNVVPFVVFLWLYRQLLERSWYGSPTKIFCLIFAAFGTYLTSYTRTFNNHIIAGFAAFFAVYCVIRIWYAGHRRWDLFAGAGLFAGVAAACELPATSLVVVLSLYLFVVSPIRALLLYIPAAALPIGGFLLTNYLALGDVVPAQARFHSQEPPYHEYYHYDGSYWIHMPPGIDAIQEPKAVYIAHMLIGHHGIFSLTPVLLISFVGILQHIFARERALRSLHVLVLLITIVVFTFYVLRTNNYGGGAQGLRWTFWMIPLWLIALPRGVDAFLRYRNTTYLALAMLAVSIFSMFYALLPPNGPWSQAWMHWLLKYYGVVSY